VSLPLFLVDDLPGRGSFVLDGPEGHHAAAVQRLRPGERLMLGDGRGATAAAEVETVGKGTLTVTVIHRRYAPPNRPHLVVAQGIPKGERGELAVAAMTEVGVDEIVPWAASRSVAIWRGERGSRSRDKWASTAREAAKQARRAWVPTVSEPLSTKELASRAMDLDGRATFVLHEEASVPLASVQLPDRDEVVLVIGPEGGVAEDELAMFEHAGAIAVRLGDNVLRTSTAGVAALSVLQTRLGRW
jgi:16S rRNA (uracil1498-N3)-methyltransferase